MQELSGMTSTERAWISSCTGLQRGSSLMFLLRQRSHTQQDRYAHEYRPISMFMAYNKASYLSVTNRVITVFLQVWQWPCAISLLRAFLWNNIQPRATPWPILHIDPIYFDLRTCDLYSSQVGTASLHTAVCVWSVIAQYYSIIKLIVIQWLFMD